MTRQDKTEVKNAGSTKYEDIMTSTRHQGIKILGHKGIKALRHRRYHKHNNYRSWVWLDKRWLNAFWKQPSKRSTDDPELFDRVPPGQTERVYEIIEAYLRAFITYVYYMQDDWDEWLDLAGAIPSTPRQEYRHSLR